KRGKTENETCVIFIAVPISCSPRDRVYCKLTTDEENDTMRRTAMHLFPTGFLGLALLAALGAAPEAPRPLTAAAVRALQPLYQAERLEADSKGLTRVFSPEWYQRAAGLAKQGEEALAAGRLVEASESFRRARWHLPTLPTHLPPHVARVFGDPR